MDIFQLRAGEDFIRLGQVLKATGMVESERRRRRSFRTALSASTVRSRREEEGSFTVETSFSYDGKELEIG